MKVRWVQRRPAHEGRNGERAPHPFYLCLTPGVARLLYLWFFAAPIEVYMSDLLERQSALIEFYGEPISVYTRSQAIDDGFLIDLSESAREVGFTVPVAITSEAFVRCIHLEKEDVKTLGVSESERVARLLRTLLLKIRNTRSENLDQCRFEVTFQAVSHGRAVEDRATIEATIGPGDEGEPVITLGHLKA